MTIEITTMCRSCETLKLTGTGHRKLTAPALARHTSLVPQSQVDSMKIYSCDTCETYWSFQPWEGWLEHRKVELEQFLVVDA